MSVPLLPLAEQRRIAGILDKADDLRQKRRTALQKLEPLTQSIFVDMFGDPAAIGARWFTKTLGDVLDFLTSGSRGWAKHYVEYGSKFLRIQNVRRNQLDLSDLAYVQAPSTSEAIRTRVQPGDVLLSITADLGRTAAIPNDIGDAYINQHLSILRTTRVDSFFLSTFLSSPAGQRQILAKNRVGVKAGLNFDDIRSIWVPLPPRELQTKFREAVTKIDQCRLVNTRLSDSSSILFRSLQNRAFGGEL
jgi:type I restriction enzyme S subunit